MSDVCQTPGCGHPERRHHQRPDGTRSVCMTPSSTCPCIRYTAPMETGPNVVITGAVPSDQFVPPVMHLDEPPIVAGEPIAEGAHVRIKDGKVYTDPVDHILTPERLAELRAMAEASNGRVELYVHILVALLDRIDSQPREFEELHRAVREEIFRTGENAATTTNGIRGQLRTIVCRLAEYRDLYAGAEQNATDFERELGRWKRAALDSGVHQSADGRIWGRPQPLNRKRRRWCWPW